MKTPLDEDLPPRPRTQPPLIQVLRSRLLRDPRAIGLAALLLPGGSLLAWSHFVEPRWLEITRHRLAHPGHGLELLHLSDLHLLGDDRPSRAMMARLGRIPCDLRVITGDLVHRKADLDRVGALLGEMPRPRLGTYACVGNWDRWCGHPLERWQQTLERAGITVLFNSGVRLEVGGRTLWLAGVDDPFTGRPDAEAALSGARPGETVVTLCHSPEWFPQLAERGVDLVLAGHTHNGQVRLPFKGAVWLPQGSGPYAGGWFTQGRSRLFVSRGIGMSVAPLRLLCRPEAAVIAL